ncbi:hypothetical protein FBR04_19210 [Betaproteobacteria bacterium PRO7]|jgi:hypothetical protein|nr:hypothetical protein [Betaproteobacteria bacterium PRO7]
MQSSAPSLAADEIAELQRAWLRREVRIDRLIVAHGGLLGELAALLGGVDREGLARWLVDREWDVDGGPERSLAALRAVEHRHQLAAAKAKSDLRRSPENVREVVDTLLLQHPTWTTKKALEEIAKASHVSPKTISNLYYKAGS